MVQVGVKWNKQTMEVDLDPSLGVDVFKSQLYSMTGVPMDRQKLMSKAWKGILKDDADFSAMNIQNGAQITLMGTAEVIQAPESKPVFLEDMTGEQQAEVGAILPAGLVNLGNTCYMNSTLQCMRCIPELKDGLTQFRPSNSGDIGANFTRSLADMFQMLERSPQAVTPMQFVSTLRNVFPQFAQTSSRGGYMQQDAEELYNAVTNVLSSNLRNGAGSSGDNLVDSLLGIEFEERWTCTETDAEPEVVRHDQTRKLVCNIQGGGGSLVQINHLHEGLRLGLEGTVEKMSDVLGRNALWHKTSRISKLPRYLCVQFMRFFWKATPESRDHTGVKTKIVRAVSFPETLDVFEYCSGALQAALRVNRDKWDRIREASDQEKKRTRLEDTKQQQEEDTSSSSSRPMDIAGGKEQEQEHEDELAAALALSMQSPDEVAVELGPGMPSDFTGQYEVFAVVTHKGRSADSGHYMGWVRQRGDEWVVFDDDEVSECNTSHIMDLKGGGDHHMAYLVFYRYKMPQV